LRWNLALFTD